LVWCFFAKSATYFKSEELLPTSTIISRPVPAIVLFLEPTKSAGGWAGYRMVNIASEHSFGTRGRNSVSANLSVCPSPPHTHMPVKMGSRRAHSWCFLPDAHNAPGRWSPKLPGPDEFEARERSRDSVQPKGSGRSSSVHYLASARFSGQNSLTIYIRLLFYSRASGDGREGIFLCATFHLFLLRAGRVPLAFLSGSLTAESISPYSETLDGWTVL
jgi:hypothetical protein